MASEAWYAATVRVRNGSLGQFNCCTGGVYVGFADADTEGVVTELAGCQELGDHVFIEQRAVEHRSEDVGHIFHLGLNATARPASRPDRFLGDDGDVVDLAHRGRWSHGGGCWEQVESGLESCSGVAVNDRLGRVLGRGEEDCFEV